MTPLSTLSDGNYYTRAMRACRYLLEKHRHEMFEEPLDLSKKHGRQVKLDTEQLSLLVDKLNKGGSVQQLAYEFGVGASTVYRIKNRERCYNEIPK